MKTLFWTLVFICCSPLTHATDEAKGFLVFEIERFTYSEGTKGGSNINQKFKIPLTEEFFSNFKGLPSQHSQGTGLFCNGGYVNTSEFQFSTPGEISTSFTWWIHKSADRRWAINIWGQGVETIKGVKIYSRNPSVSQDLMVKNWEDIDMRYLVSYVNKYDGINVSFRARYVAAEDMKADGPIPFAPVLKADQSPLFKGDDSSEFYVEVHCGFQED